PYECWVRLVRGRPGQESRLPAIVKPGRRRIALTTAAVTPEKTRQEERYSPWPGKLFPLDAESLMRVRRWLMARSLAACPAVAAHRGVFKGYPGFIAAEAAGRPGRVLQRKQTRAAESAGAPETFFPAEAPRPSRSAVRRRAMPSAAVEPG